MINSRFFKSLAFFAILFSIYSCSDESKTLDNADFGFQYFPLEIGSMRLYRVDSTTVDNLGGLILPTTTFIKDEITGSFANASGETVFRVERSKSSTRDGDYRISDIWTTQKSENIAISTEENLRFNKLAFPITQSSKWEGNTFENLTEVFIAGESVWVYKDWGDYEVVADGIDMRVFGVEYNDVISVKEADHDFGIERRSSYAHYAPNIGLIKKEMIILDTQCECPGQDWLEKATRGFVMTQILIEHN